MTEIENDDLGINIVNTIRKSYDAPVFRLIDLTQQKLEPELAAQFCVNFRMKVNEFLKKVSSHTIFFDYSAPENSMQDASGFDLTIVADTLNMPLILFSTQNFRDNDPNRGGHWTLLLTPPQREGGLVTVYDPNADSTVREVWLERDEMSGRAYASNTADILGSDYNLIIPDVSRQRAVDLESRIQFDSYNCGIFCFLIALLRLNFLGKLDDLQIEEVKNYFGLILPISSSNVT